MRPDAWRRATAQRTKFADLTTVAGGPGQPLVELGLGAGGQGQPACGEPVQERRGGGDVVAHVLDLLAGGGPAVEAAAQAAQVMPGGVSAQGLPVPGIRLPGDGLADPAFQGCEALVPGRERARGDQHRPHVGESAARRQRVECLVRDDAAGGDGLESAADGGVLQPVQHEVGTVDADHGLPEPVQLGGGSAARRGEGLLQSPVQAAARALRSRQLPGLLAGRAPFPEGRVGVEAARAERLAQRASLQRRPGPAA